MAESRYLEFLKVDDTGKTEKWQILSKRSGYVLGHIQWYGAWRQYCFYPSPSTIFNPECMRDISLKITELMEERRK